MQFVIYEMGIELPSQIWDLIRPRAAQTRYSDSRTALEDIRVFVPSTAHIYWPIWLQGGKNSAPHPLKLSWKSSRWKSYFTHDRE
jgi:hypothetical protein